MSRRKKKGKANVLANIPIIEITLSNDEISKEIETFNYKNYPAFGQILEILKPINNSIKHMVCLGVGDLCNDANARKQLSFILGLRKELNNECNILYYDPITCSSCLSFLETKFSYISIEKENRLGQYDASGTCFFAFHVPFFLLNNIVIHNLTKEKIENFLLIGNSFDLSYRTNENILTKTIDNQLIQDIPLDFNKDISFEQIHLMKTNKEKINSISDSFWDLSQYKILPQTNG